MPPDGSPSPSSSGRRETARAGRTPGRSWDLQALADAALAERGLDPSLLPGEQQQVVDLVAGLAPPGPSGARDLRALLWCSIDNEGSRDLDQLTVSEPVEQGATRILVAIADVDSLVPQASPLDLRAQRSTCSIYTPTHVYPMLPEELSTDLTSLGPHVDRTALVIDFTVAADGYVTDGDVCVARVRNHAKLDYGGVASWLDGQAPSPAAAAVVDGMEAQLREQDRVGQLLERKRHYNGSLTLESIEPRARVTDGQVLSLELVGKDRTRQMIEDFMITTNGVVARFLAAREFPSLRRVVREPERWDRIVAIAQERGCTLPAAPCSKALEGFLQQERHRDPLHFADLSLAVVKLIGRGSYAVLSPGSAGTGHFGLAVHDYAHSTAPNRRYADLVTQRLLKAAVLGQPCPYTISELQRIADQCNARESDAHKVERQLRKSAAALHLSGRYGDIFPALITGKGPKGTWVRLIEPPAEGRLVAGSDRVEVGAKVQVRLRGTDVARGFIDFEQVGLA